MDIYDSELEFNLYISTRENTMLENIDIKINLKIKKTMQNQQIQSHSML